jgi:hypothetical protein
VALIAAFIVASVVMLPAQSGDLIADLVLGQNDFTHSGNNIPDAHSFIASFCQWPYTGLRQFTWPDRD